MGKQVSSPVAIKTPGGISRRLLALWLILIVAAAVLGYAPSLRFEFVLDDHAFARSPIGWSLASAPQAFCREFVPKSTAENPVNTLLAYYRPLVVVSYQADSSLLGSGPLGYHATNLLLHVIASLLLFLIALRLTANVAASGIAGTAFAVWPSHVESVAWVSGRTDLMSAVFVFAALLVFDAALRRPRFSLPLGLGCSFLCACALFSKENAAVYPLLLGGYAWILARPLSPKDLLKWAALLLIPLCGYFAARQAVLGVVVGKEMSLALGDRLLGVGVAYLSYLRMLFVPMEPRVLYDVFPVVTRHPALALAAWSVPTGLLALALLKRKRFPVPAYSLLWILVTLLPVCNIIPTHAPLPAERFTYMSGMASSLLLGLAAVRVWGCRPKCVAIWPVVASALIACFLLYSGAQAVVGSGYYRSNVAWARQVVESGSRFHVFELRSAAMLAAGGLLDEAAKGYEKVMADDPLNVAAVTGLARVRCRMGRPDEAMQLLVSVKEKLPQPSADIAFEMGIIYFAQHHTAPAADSFAQAVRLSPGFGLAWRDLAKAQMRLGRFSQAAEAYKKADSLHVLLPEDRAEYEAARRARTPN
ncbi:MAG TPA: tetratricopeptide repeat protein [Chloroflexota bacterium]|nr:tetratricopeptide repeat protein [Chloroflexota bacterium]